MAKCDQTQLLDLNSQSSTAKCDDMYVTKCVLTSNATSQPLNPNNQLPTAGEKGSPGAQEWATLAYPANLTIR